LLHAYFDESGIHRGSPVTFVAGFVGTTQQWRGVKRQWTTAMGGEMFHYKDMALETELLERLADILATSELMLVSTGFSGDWEKTISQKADWKKRFPSSYHFLWEMAAEFLNRHCAKKFGEPIAMMFSRQNEYSKRAEEVWRTFRGNDQWKNLVSFTYGDPERFPHLQAADMLSYETFQCMKIGTEEVWHEWPLMRRILFERVPPMTGLSGYHTAESLVALLEKGDSEGNVVLKTIPKPQPTKRKKSKERP
jgi:hypothetical protein